MYTAKHYEESDPQRIAAFLNDNPFGTLVSVVDGQALTSHVPFHFDADKRQLIGHLARANGQWESLENASDVLVMVMGPHGYVSPTWYQSPGVPTWNYAAVHVRGRAEVVDNPQSLHEIVMDLTRRFETQRERAWDGEYNTRLLERIVGFRIHISDIQAKFKLSQNRSREERESVMAELSASEQCQDRLLAELMEESIGRGSVGRD